MKFIIIMCLTAVVSAMYTGDTKMVRLSQVSTDFAQALQPYLRVGSLSESNCVFSAYSIYITLCNLVNGTSGLTQTEMYNATQIYRFTGSVSKPHEANYNALEEYRTDTLDGTVYFATYISLNPNTTASEKFLDHTRTYYPSKVDYHNLTDARGPEQRINDFCKNNTGGVTKDIVPSGVITSSTQIVLASSCAIFTIWNEPFDHTRTHIANFTLETGKTIEVYMMSDDQRQVTYLSDYNGSVVTEIPFSSYRYSLVLIMPSKGIKLTDLEISYSQSGKLLTLFQKLDEIRQTKAIHINVPKFHITSTFELTSALQNIGMIKAFDPANANFQQLSKGRPYISKHFHRMDFWITENGTEPLPGAPPPKHIFTLGAPTVQFNRPFLYFCRDLDTNTTILQGTFYGK